MEDEAYGARIEPAITRGLRPGGTRVCRLGLPTILIRPYRGCPQHDARPPFHPEAAMEPENQTDHIALLALMICGTLIKRLDEVGHLDEATARRL
ncbi:MAG: hypothetical protein ABW194_11085, partial [Novosphingobium sp.]